MGVHDGRLKIALRSPPADGKANKELVSLLASITGISKRAITIRRGLGAKKKEVLFEGVTLDFLAATLEISEGND